MPGACRKDWPARPAILDHASKSDFGIFVLAPDDAAIIKGESQSTVRDNVLFESGVFMRKLGPRRTFLLWPSEVVGKLRLPSDLNGFTLVTYDPQGDTRSHIEEIRTAILTLGPALNSGYDEIAALEQRLNSRSIDLEPDPSETLMEIVQLVAAKRRAAWQVKTPVEDLMNRLDKIYKDDIVDDVFWWLVVYGIVAFTGIEHWNDGEWDWRDSMPYVAFTERGVVLLNHLRSTARRNE